ncbi:MAG: LacI family DNA-binding transcriptional regulator [Chthoniobacteraceae bacterium]
MGANLKQIALESGVSIPTASRVLRNLLNFAPETKQRVLAAAERLKYRPNLLVSGIRTGKTSTIGVIIPSPDVFFNNVLHGIHDELVAANHVPIVLLTHSDGELIDRDYELTQIHMLLDRRVDGIIFRPINELVGDSYRSEVMERNIPLTAIDSETPLTKADFVGTDDIFGAKLCAEHLLSLGHRHVAHLAGPSNVSTARDRWSGFEAAIAKGGGTCITLEALSYVEDLTTAIQLLESNPRPTAIFASSDPLAESAYQAASMLRLKIPEDLSVVGYSDLDIAHRLSPPLTTVHQNPYQIGQSAARLVMNRSLGKVTPSRPVKVRLKPELVVRSSTAQPASDRHQRRHSGCLSDRAGKKRLVVPKKKRDIA